MPTSSVCQAHRELESSLFFLRSNETDTRCTMFVYYDDYDGDDDGLNVFPEIYFTNFLHSRKMSLDFDPNVPFLSFSFEITFNVLFGLNDVLKNIWNCLYHLREILNFAPLTQQGRNPINPKQNIKFKIIVIELAKRLSFVVAPKKDVNIQSKMHKRKCCNANEAVMM